MGIKSFETFWFGGKIFLERAISSWPQNTLAIFVEMMKALVDDLSTKPLNQLITQIARTEAKNWVVV